MPGRSEPLITVVTPTFNEAENVSDLVQRIRRVLTDMDLTYEHLIIDNCSNDGTIELISALAHQDERIKVIINESNYGHIRSPFYGLLQARGRAAIVIASDLQDPPECLPELIAKWREGHKVVFLVRRGSDESRFVSSLRATYYRLLRTISRQPSVHGATGAGLYDRQVIEVLRNLDDPYPYVRGLVSELGYNIGTVEFVQPARAKGKSKNGLSTLYDLAMLGITSSSRAPLRAMSALGFGLAAVSLAIGVIYLARKLLAWDSFDLGLAPIAVGIFFLGAVQLICLGILGEYIGNVFLQVRRHPLVIERERINFD